MLDGPKSETQTATSCLHTWASAETPPDSGYRWYRCGLCLAYGYRHRGRGALKTYKCTWRECREVAVDRLQGRTTQGSGYRWRCAEHRVEPGQT